MRKIEHIGIAVRDMESSEKLYTRLFGVEPYKREYVASENVHTSFFKLGINKIELLWSDDSDNPISKFIERRGEGIHHIAYDVADIRATMDQMKADGFELINPNPKKGADNKWVCFIHPKTAGGVLVELCQEIEI